MMEATDISPNTPTITAWADRIAVAAAARSDVRSMRPS